MDEELNSLVEKCAKLSPEISPSPEVIDTFCARHSITRDQFAQAFAGYVAREFADGAMAYWHGDYAMNWLAGALTHDFSGFAWDIFLAFDAGEFIHEEDPPCSKAWQLHTLPDVMEALARQRPEPSA